jgi:uncharacterized protein YfaQ (DUF2300 family)
MKPQFSMKDYQKNGEFDADAYNAAAFYTMSANYVECKNCGRTFEPDRLIVHQRSCNSLSKNIKKARDFCAI